MMWLSCVFGHADRVRERDAEGRSILVCPDCRDWIYLDSQAEYPKGPKAEPDRVLGQPDLKAQRVWTVNTRKSA